jgi:hypothetical protein
MSELTWQELRRTDFSGLEDTAALWSRYIGGTADLEDALFKDIDVLQDDSADFAGATADALRGNLKRTHDIFAQDVTDYADPVQKYLQAAAEDFTSVQQDLEDLIAEAGINLEPAGGLGEERFNIASQRASDFHDTGMSTQEREDEQQRLLERAAALSDEFIAIMERAREIDDQLAADLKALDDDVPPLPPRIGEPGYLDKTAEYLRGEHEAFIDRIESGEATPEEVNEWWNSLSEADQDVFTRGMPELVGPTDGFPAENRDTANRILLDEQINNYDPDLDEQISSLEAAIADMDPDTDDFAEAELYERYQEELADLKDQRDDRDALTALQDRIAEPYPGTGQDYYLFKFDTEDTGGAIVSIGNPDTAANTGVFVPGTFATIDNFTGENGALDRAERMAYDADFYGTGEETAMIAWMDYDTPQSASPSDEIPPEAMWSGAAEDGAVTLNHFVDGLEATHQGESSDTTVIGHSYGTRLVGEAAQYSNTNIDQIVAVASPGLGVDHASELGIDEEDVWVTTAEGDAIKDAPGFIHGTDPDEQGTVMTGFGDDAERHDGYGANVFESEAMGDSGGQIHGGYWNEGNDARVNIAFIVTGQTENVELVGG